MTICTFFLDSFHDELCRERQKSCSEGCRASDDVLCGVPLGRKCVLNCYCDLLAERSSYMSLVGDFFLIEHSGLNQGVSFFFFGHSTDEFPYVPCILSSITGLYCCSPLLSVQGGDLVCKLFIQLSYMRVR